MKTKPEARSQKPEVGNRKPEAGNPPSIFCPLPSALRLPPSERGVALIITLILLAVVTFMALTFLAVSRRERNAVTTTTDTASAQLAADDALASAEGQIVASMLASTNPYNFGLLVSTNYINAAGFDPNLVGYSPTNVNYDYLTKASGGGPLSQGQFLQNLANLYYLPRTPVYMSNLVTRTMENRFYLDLNRNGYFETNGPVVDAGGTETNLEVGDPEWVGILQHPDQPYGPNNPFVARYAFIALPIGNALDLNAIYNYTIGVKGNAPITAGNDMFMRNQGVGPWEINLAAFLADLNNNEWGQIVGSGANPPAGSAAWYQYNEANPAPFANAGAAFNDALSLLSYRYAYNYNTLAPAGGPNGVLTRFLAFPPLRANIDYYSDGPLMTTPAGINVGGQIVILPWSGADNTNHFFDLQELYDPNKTSPAFVNRLQPIGDAFNLNNSDPTNFYNRYTYYRLLSQLGVESVPEQNKLNLNYSNALVRFDRNGVVTNIAIFPNAETNFTPWTPLQFFTIAADKMLRTYSQEWLVESPSNYLATYGSFTNISTAVNPVLDSTNMPIPFGITNIPVYVNGQFVYTPAVQRVLQLAANICDATTNNTAVLGADFPSVFRPIFEHDNLGNVFIAGYTNLSSTSVPNTVSGTADPQLALPYEVASITNFSPNFTPITDANGLVNVYGVPWIIGAKKGWPNFNEFAMESTFQLTRKLQVTRPNTNSPTSAYQYNQMFNLSVSNEFGVECWNSYTNIYPRAVAMYVTCTNSCLFTNSEGFNTSLGSLISGFLPIPMNLWRGYNPTVDPLGSQLSFQIPLYTNVTIITNSMYRFNVGGNFEEPGHIGPYLTTNLALPFEANVTGPDGSPYPQPHWWLVSSNDVRVVMLDTQTGPPYHVIDYVQLSGPNTYRDLTSEIISNYDTATGPSGNDLWNTNIQNNLPIGLISLIGVSLGSYTPGAGSGTWAAQSEIQREDEIDGFRAFFHYSPLFNNAEGQEFIAKAGSSNYTQAPYLPTATVVQHFSWQANDPLVHYTAGDLNWAGANLLNRNADDLTNEDLGQLNQRYMPWGGNPLLAGADPNPYNLALKDPMVRQSDDWDFPTYKFPSVGWLGRVHRGTPWQTVYLKAPDILQQTQVSGVTTNYIGTNSWLTWTGNGNSFDAANARPAQDRLLFDVFSTAPNDNATRGQLSVNVDAGNPSAQAGMAAWSALFSGVLVLSNNAVDGAIPTNSIVHAGAAANTWFAINPAGPAGSNSPLGRLVAGINQIRNSFVNPDGLTGSFEHVGDVLAVPQLAWQSPFLNWNDPVQQVNGISDELYEWLPQQVMSLLRASDSPRYAIYSYGQTLKPAPNGINTGSGPFFGMVTNYQVVAETATRAVVRFNGTRVNGVLQTNYASGGYSWITAPSVTNNTAVIEQFNVLPSN